MRLMRTGPFKTFVRPPRHFLHMRNRVMHPVAIWLQLRSAACHVLGARIVTPFFQSEGVHGAQNTQARLRLAPEWQRPRRAISDRGKSADRLAEPQRCEMRDE